MSTRRARIKAVTALPPRRKNVDTAANRKKQEESQDGLESVLKPVSIRRPSFDKTPNDQWIPIDSVTQEHTREGFEVRVSPTKRRLSVDKIQGRRLSVDKCGHVKEGCDNEPKTPRSRRLSIDKTPKRRLSVDKTPKRRMSVDKTLKRRMSVDKIPAKCLSAEVITVPEPVEKPVKSADSNQDIQTNLSHKKVTESKIPVTEDWFPSNKILKNLLNSSATTPKRFYNEPEKVASENKPSTSKEGNVNDNEKESGMPKVPFFASPIGRASPRRPSPIVRTPIIEVDLIAEKMIAPHKGPNSVSCERNYMEIHATDANQKSNAEVDLIIEKIVNKEELKKLENALPKKSKCPIKIIDEYVIKPVPETSTVMDGIVPLQSASKAPKPLDLLKNEIISENAEVLFDPIVPLPSPSKVRPKLRPIPRLGPRRNSFQQGSASESEDENRRLHGRPSTPATPGLTRQRHDSHSVAIPRDVARVRNDSVCSSASQAPSQTTAVSSPMREREKSLKTRREEMAARRNAAMRRRETEVERDKLTMYDLIFYNPTANPIIPDQDEIKAKEANKKEEEDRKAEAKVSSKDESLDSLPLPTAVPQIKLGANGEIILDEQSLVVNQSDQRKLEVSVVREGAWGGSGSRAYRRTARTADWSDAETVRFYRALATMGTDFTLMQPLFPARSRRDLKLKFKKEERQNLAQVDKALRSGAEWDPTRLETEFTEERKAAEEAAKKAKERLKKQKADEKTRQKDMKHLRMRRSRCSKTLGDSAMPLLYNQNKTTPSTLDEYVQFQEERAKKAKQRSSKKRKQEDTTKNEMVPPASPSSSYATITRITHQPSTRPATPKKPTTRNDVTLTKGVPLPTGTAVPPNIETGSLVVLTVNDPQSPSRKMLQTYIAQGPGNLAPVSLPANFLNSVVGFMKKSNSPVPTVVGSPKTTRSKTPNILAPRKRTSSYTITQL